MAKSITVTFNITQKWLTTFFQKLIDETDINIVRPKNFQSYFHNKPILDTLCDDEKLAIYFLDEDNILFFQDEKNTIYPWNINVFMRRIQEAANQDPNCIINLFDIDDALSFDIENAMRLMFIPY